MYCVCKNSVGSHGATESGGDQTAISPLWITPVNSSSRIVSAALDILDYDALFFAGHSRRSPMYTVAAIQLVTITVTMLVLDAIWLTATSATSRSLFAAIQGQPLQVRWIPALLVYVIMVAAAWYFAVAPASSVTEATGRGAILGFAMYGLYDLTNYATISKYTLEFAITDMAWGTFLFAVASGISKAVLSI